MKRSPAPGPRRSRPFRQVLGGAVALSLAVGGGALASPAAAAPAKPVLKITPGSEIVSAGATGFLSVDPESHLEWTRYEDGRTTDVGRSWGQDTSPVEHGSVSDVVVLGDEPIIEAARTLILRDMSTGSSTFVDLEKLHYMYEGAVGPWVIASAHNGKRAEVHVLGTADGQLTDRKVTGLPDNVFHFYAVAGTPGSAVLRFPTQPEDPEHKAYDYAVVDLAAAKVSDSHVLQTGEWAGAAVSPDYVASLGSALGGGTNVSTARRGPLRQPWKMDLPGISSKMVGLVGDWVVYGNDQTASSGHDAWQSALRATSIGSSIAPDRKVLDHATSMAPTPEGDLLVMGGSVDQGEGLYRVSTGADHRPVVKLVASTGEPTKLTLVGSDMPAVAQLDQGRWRARWQLSRGSDAVSVTLRHTASGKQRTFGLRAYTEDDMLIWAEVAWDGLLGSGNNTVAAPNGAYTWKLDAKPNNGIGPDLHANGKFTVRHKSAPHDYTDNGSPDVLLRDSAGNLSLQDTYHDSRKTPHLKGTASKSAGWGWNIYDKVTAVGNVAGASAGDVVARDSAGVLWLYLGKGDGTFDGRLKIGAGWDAYDQLTGGSDLNGDGRGDLLARDHSGVLWLYEGTGNWRAPFAPRKKIGAGWGSYDHITAVGDVAGASAGDVVARDRSGVLWLFLGRGDGTLDGRVKIGAGWSGYRQMIGIGDANADGRADLLVTTPDGSSYAYHGTGNWRTPFAPRELTGVRTPSSGTIA